MSNPDDTSNIVTTTAASIPDAVKHAFSGERFLTLADVLLLEQAGCRFIASGGVPTYREMTVIYWLLADKDGFRRALASGDLDAELQTYADSLPPSIIPAAAHDIKGILARSFSLAAGVGKPTPTPPTA